MNIFVKSNLAAPVAGLVMAGALCVATTPAVAADLPPDARAALEAASAELLADREALIDANLDLTPAEAQRFWPLYREYISKRKTLGDQRIDMVIDYASAYPDVDDAKAKSLIGRSLKWDRQAADLRQRYAKEIGTVLPATKLMRFLQIEKRVDNAIELQLQALVPIVDVRAN